MTMGGADLMVVLRMRDDATKALKGFSGGLKGMSNQLKAMRGPLLAVAGSMGAMGVLSVKAASDMEESINAVNVVFGEAADVIHKFGTDSATSVGLSTAAFNQMATQTGALLKDTGLSMDDVAGQTNDLATRAADLASVFNTDVNDALSAINQAIRGETEAIRRYTGDVTDATLGQFLLAKGIEGSVSEMDQQQKRLLRVQVLMAQTAFATGDFANTSDSLANSIRIAKGELTNVAAELGTTLIPAVTAVVGFLGKMVQMFADLPGPVRTTLLVVGLLAGALAAVGLIIPPLIGGFTAMSGLLPVVSGMLGLTTVSATGASVAFGALSLSLLPVTAVILGIAAAIAVGILVWKNWDKIVNVVKATWTVVSAKIESIFKSKWAWLLPGGPLIKAILAIKNNWTAIWSFISDAYRKISDVIVGAFQSKWGWLLPGGALVKALMWLKKNWDEIWGDIADGFQKVSDVMAIAFRPMKALFGEIQDEVVRLEQVTQDLEDGLEETGQRAGVLASQIDTTTRAYETNADAAKGLKDEIVLVKEAMKEEGAQRQQSFKWLLEDIGIRADRGIQLQKELQALEDQEDQLKSYIAILGPSSAAVKTLTDETIDLTVRLRLGEIAFEDQTEAIWENLRSLEAGRREIENNREAWDLWEFEQSKVNQALKKTGATWNEILQGVADDTNLNLKQVKFILRETGVGIDDLQGLIEQFGDKWVEEFVRMRKESAKGLGIDKLKSEFSPNKKGQRASELGLQGRLNIEVGDRNKAISHIRNQLGGLTGADRTAAQQGIADLRAQNQLILANAERFLAGDIGINGILAGLAHGARNFRGGMAMVGERGPELVRLPRGADVFSNRESRQMAGRNANVTVQILGDVFGVDDLERKVAQAVIRARARGAEI